jgi:hypothetical protein
VANVLSMGMGWAGGTLTTQRGVAGGLCWTFEQFQPSATIVLAGIRISCGVGLFFPRGTVERAVRSWYSHMFTGVTKSCIVIARV